MKPGAEHPLAGFVLAAALATPGVASAATAPPPLSAAEQVQRMAAAVSSLSFEGTLVYLHENRLETLHIYHAIEDGQARERLVSMTGPVRAVTREDDEITCILPNSHPISIKRHGVARDLLRSRAMDLDAIDRYYRLHALGVARVAGRETDVVGIIPRDALRYGYRFYLDRETGLPLKTDLMGSDAEPIEQVMFTTVKLTATAPGAAMVADAASQAKAPVPPARDDRWRFERLPAGFELVMHQLADGPESAGAEHFLLSDGLASMSVYVERGDGEGLDGETHIGAINAVGGRVDGHRVTVVGEVPAMTVAAVLAGIRYAGDGPR